MEHQAGKNGSKGITLRKAFVLEEVVRRTIRTGRIAVDRRAIHEIKVWQEGMELGVVSQNSASCMTGNGIEHVGNVKGEKGTMGSKVGSKGAINVLMELGLSRMEKKINTTTDGDAELTFCEKESGEAIGIESHDNRSSNAAVGSTNANGA
jgi:hypothetical protein